MGRNETLKYLVICYFAGNSELTTYKVTVKTSEHITGAGTDANVYINIQGSQGSTSDYHLKTSSLHKDPFETGMTDMFFIKDVPSVGRLQNLRVYHDNKGEKENVTLLILVFMLKTNTIECET